MQNNHNLRWRPFNSLVDTSNFIKVLDEKRSECEMPCLTNEQLLEIGEKINEEYEKEEIVIITYYKNNKKQTISGRINKVNKTNKTIQINDQNISFYKIVKIS